MPLSETSLDDLASNASYESNEEDRLAQEEWQESLQQLQQLVSVVIMPFFGKWLGRRWSYWGKSSFSLVILRETKLQQRMLATLEWVLENLFFGDRKRGKDAIRWADLSN